MNPMNCPTGRYSVRGLDRIYSGRTNRFTAHLEPGWPGALTVEDAALQSIAAGLQEEAGFSPYAYGSPSGLAAHADRAAGLLVLTWSCAGSAD